MKSELYEGNCINILPEFLGRGIDAVVTDPPLNFGHEDFPSSAANWKDKYEDGNEQRLLATLCREACKPNALAVVFFDTRCIPSCTAAWKSAGWEFQRLLTVARAWRPRVWAGWRDASDIAAVFSAGPSPVFHAQAVDDVYGDHVWHEEIQTGGHPVGKSIDAVAQIVRNVCPPGGTVLDPFMGAGSVGEACRIEGRNFIGIESERQWFNIAEEKLAA